MDEAEETAADCGADVTPRTGGEVLSIEVVEAGDLELVTQSVTVPALAGIVGRPEECTPVPKEVSIGVRMIGMRVDLP